MLGSVRSSLGALCRLMWYARGRRFDYIRSRYVGLRSCEDKLGHCALTWLAEVRLG